MDHPFSTNGLFFSTGRPDRYHRVVYLAAMGPVKRYLGALQGILWLLSFALFFFYLRQRLAAYPLGYVLGFSTSSFVFFALLIYGYTFLYNRYFHRWKLAPFVAAVVLLFASTVAVRILLENLVVAPLSDRTSIFQQKNTHVYYVFTSSFFALIIGVLFKSFAEAIFLRERQGEIQKKHLETELAQLKAHVQPHFLFNSLNNLYYDTYKVLPDVAERIVRLSGIMRYFMEESPKEKVLLATEIAFLENYIELEKIRIPFPVAITLQNDADPHLLIPPMLLIPLVENAFKHGLQKNGRPGNIDMKLLRHNNRLTFCVTNPVVTLPGHTQRSGTGLKNLRDRLALLFNHHYELHTFEKEGRFTAKLTIPVHED
jgi:sensor histidine kinase YesM